MAAKWFYTGLEGKTAVVCGSDNGVGYHLAASLAKQGCKLVLIGRALNLTSVVERIAAEVAVHRGDEDSDAPPASGKKCQCSAQGQVKIVDLDEYADEGRTDAAVDEAWRAFGSLDILLHAGLYQGVPTPALELTEGEWDRTMSVNLTGVWLLTKAVSKRMQQQGRGGSIVFVTSIVGTERCFFPGYSAFGTSVAAVHYLAQALAMELGKYQIRVNVVAKGVVDSDPEINEPPKLTKDVVPLKRWLDVTHDLEALVLLYAGDLNKYLTGNITYTDGGLSIVRPRMKASL